MPKTGNIFIDALLQVAIFLPLIPVIIIFLKKVYQQEVLNFLMILCLLNFIENLLLHIPQLLAVSEATLENIFSLLEVLILIQIFKSAIKGRWKEILNIFLIAFLSAIITYYFLKGTDQKSMGAAGVENGIIILFALFALFKLIRNHNLFIFHSPLFWIAAGSLFYFAILILLEIVSRCCRMQLPSSLYADKTLLISIAGIIRYLFYILAIVLYRSPGYKEKIPGH